MSKVLRERLGEDGAEALVDMMNRIEPDPGRIKNELLKEFSTKSDIVRVENKIEILDTKIERLEAKIERLEVEFKSDIKRLEVEFKSDIERLEAELKEKASKADILELKTEIEKSKTETLKWVFLFWIGQLAVMATLFKLFVK